MEDEIQILLDPVRSATEAEFEATWARLLQGPARNNGPARTEGQSSRSKVPRVGTIIQRSTSRNERKLKALMEPPPPPPPRRRNTPPTPRRDVSKGITEQLEDLFGDITDLDKPEEDNAPPVIHGPSGPPPVLVTIDGTTIEVPYFAAVVARKWRTRIGNQRLVLRFDREGKCQFVRKL